MSRGQDIRGILRGFQILVDASRKENAANLQRLWANSSFKEVVESNLESTKKCVNQVASNPGKEFENLLNLVKESYERTSVVVEGVKQLSNAKLRTSDNRGEVKAPPEQEPPSPGSLDPSNLDISSITLKELEQLLSQHNKNRKVSLRLKDTKQKQVEPETSASEPPSNPQIAKHDEDSASRDESYYKGVLGTISKSRETPASSPPPPGSAQLPNLSEVAKQRKVPSSRIGRMASFGSLFAGLGLGTVSELTKGALGLGGAKDMREALLSPANAQRIVDTLCKVRGAALKLGQILSIQDSNIISPELVKAFERVRQAADYMPDWQVERVMVNQLGADWRKKFKEFDQKPFAAASIGQVHRAVALDGTELAIKIQYPGVAKSIESDIDNLIGMLKVWDVFPAGFYIDNLVQVAKRELNWEVDYLREAEYTEKFGEMIANSPEYYVPKVLKDLCTSNVLTTELVPGLPLDKCFAMSYDDRKFIGTSVLKLCLRELFELQCMQTDPNWSNFLYDKNSQKLMLIDFGSTRFYTRDFIKKYRKVIVAAINDDRQKVLDYSRDIGFLTGYESKQMQDAHVDAVMILGEMFCYPGEFDFGKQNTTKRIAHLVPTMLAHRLRPPPEEIYSIHRKLSGVFLLCAKLDVKIDCRPYYEEIIAANES
ncbi:unnamed protein product [Hermetia illucens]|uniref:ABC1 atypical kinase-like domain-containing protein n=1 Tax=Hermetia illucens TaxID=343691 RepID=A0A7R8UT68_HERIL|nr:atypical kinase COQ8B, mitochondrial [Hermetia illucens]CAD7086604.1 unnamed protein product [Hermetia illucens]